MAFVMRISPRGFSSEMYDEVLKKLEAAGESAPAGRLFHVCFRDKEDLRISDIWDTRENFERFFAIVGGLMREVGVPQGKPEFFEVHNFIEGAKASSTAG